MAEHFGEWQLLFLSWEAAGLGEGVGRGESAVWPLCTRRRGPPAGRGQAGGLVSCPLLEHGARRGCFF